MDAKQSHTVKEIALHLSPIINVHELARDQPSSDGTRSHPAMRNAQKVAIQPAKSTQLHACSMVSEILQSDLFASTNMMMSYVRRIADHKVVASCFLRY